MNTLKTKEELKDATVYVMFLKGELHTKNKPENFYVGCTTLSLEERLKKHKRVSSIGNKSRNICDAKVYKVMRTKGLENWGMEAIEYLKNSTRSQIRELERFYIRLLEPDLNTQNGTKSDKKCEYDRKRSKHPWTCELCNVTTGQGNKWSHKKTRMHKGFVWLNSLD